MIHPICRLATCILLMLFADVNAADTPRIAVLGNDSVEWSDLLMTRLSESPAVSLVERNEIGKALDEITLKDLAQDRKMRSRFGEIAGADFLVFLTVTEHRARLVVCDTELGVILQDQNIETIDQLQKNVIDRLTKSALQTVESFAGGVRQVVAVPNFLCRDLTFDFTYLQSDYAEVLRSAYLQIPGLAVVAIEEAKAIAVERDIAGMAQKDRIVSIFIEGEYRTKRDLKRGGVGVEFTLRARDSEKVLIERKLESVPMSQAGREIMSVFAEDLAKLTRSGEIKIDELSQYRMLLERADEFGMIGEFLRSTELREAALLIKPDDDEQRIKLIREYVRHIGSLKYESNGWPIGAKPADIDPRWVAISERALSDWKRSLLHAEYLVINHRLTRGQAAIISDNVIDSMLGSRLIFGEQVNVFEELKRDFVRHVFSQIPHWDIPPRGTKVKNLTGEMVLHDPKQVYDYIFRAACSGMRNIEDLDLVHDLVVHLLPETMPPSPNVIFYMNSLAGILISHKDVSNFVSIEEYHRFLDRLMVAGRPLARVYGRYGKFCLRKAKGEDRLALLEEVESILAEAEAIGYNVSGYDGFISVFRNDARMLREGILREVNHTVPVPPWQPPVPNKSVPKPKLRIALEPIELRLSNTKNKGKLLTSDLDWRSSSGFSGVEHYESFTKDLDVIWGQGAVFFMSRPGKLIRVFEDDKSKVTDVVCDSRYVWVGTANDWGISVLDLKGGELARIGQKDGLPPGSHGIKVHPIEPGRVLVAGSFGIEHRAWIAVVEFDGMTSKVEVIHEATKLIVNPEVTDRADPALAFVPTGMVEHVIPGNKPKRIVFVLRNSLQPLTVDLESLKVQVYPGNSSNNMWYPRFSMAPPDDVFLSHDGILWIAVGYDDFAGYRLNEKTGLLDPVREHPEANIANMIYGSLAREGEWLYHAGHSKWRRLNLKTGKEEPLLQYTRNLPNYGIGKWHLHHSAHYGLVVFNDGSLYRLKTTSKESNKKKFVMNPSQIQVCSILGAILCLVFVLFRCCRRKRAMHALADA